MSSKKIAQISVFGLGKIGLPLAVQFALKNFQVHGIDLRQDLIETINSGIAPYNGECDLQENLSAVVKAGKLRATSKAELAVASSDVIVVAVPLIVDSDGQPDFKILDNVTQKIGLSIQPGTLVCYETTLPIGTTRQRFLSEIERIANLVCPRDFNLVFSPERVLTGRVFSDLRRYPKIVGGITDECTSRGVSFYEQVLDFDDRKDLPSPNGVWKMGSSEEAEFVKLAETTFRDVNIALSNQFAMDANSHKLDISRVINAANSQPYSMIHTPGIAVGGHCIPVYPQLYLSTQPGAKIIRVARELNQSMPSHFIDKLEKHIGKLDGKEVAVVGISYRPGVKEVAFSGAFSIQKILINKGAKPKFLDPLYTSKELSDLGFEPLNADGSDVEAVIVHTHDNQTILNLKQLFPNCRIVLDGRGQVAGMNIPDDIEIIQL
jgi:UDP-N-acetyl-D-glucosamine dehydrogenase